MLLRDGGFALKVLGLHVHAGHLCGKILGLDTDGRQEVSQRARLWHAHLSLHHIGAEAEERLVALGADDGKGLVVDPTLVQHTREFLLSLLKLGTSFYALHVQESLFNELHATGLHSKVGLGKGNLRLLGVTILSHEITGIAREHDIIDLTNCPTSQLDLFIDVTKMVCNWLAHVFTGRFRLVNHVGEILPQAIAQQLLHIACAPALHLINHAHGFLKAFEQCLYIFFLHVLPWFLLFLSINPRCLVVRFQRIIYCPSRHQNLRGQSRGD